MSTPIDNERVRELIGQDAQLMEVLPEAAYGEEHLPGASRHRAVIVYCWDSL